MFLTGIASEEAEDRTPTLMSIVSTLTNILDAVEDNTEIMMKVEGSVLKIILAVFSTKNVGEFML